MLLQQILPFVVLLLDHATATCYFPDGDVSSADVACDSEASDSFCCFSNQACLSNKLCLTGTVDGVDQFARGTCTDSTWQSGACPNFCLDQQALGNAMFSCNTTGVDNYCCNDGCSCDSGAGNEVVDFSGTPYTISVIGVAGTYPNPSATPASSVDTTSSSPTAETTTSSSSSAYSSATSTNGGAVSTSSASNTAAAAAASSTSSTPSASSKSGSNSVAVGAGVGVGVGLVVVLLGAGALFLYHRRAKGRKSADTYEEKSAPGHSETAGYPNSSGYYPDHVVKQQHTMSSNASELGPAGHEYSELGTGRANTGFRGQRRLDAAELPGQ